MRQDMPDHSTGTCPAVRIPIAAWLHACLQRGESRFKSIKTSAVEVLADVLHLYIIEVGCAARILCKGSVLSGGTLNDAATAVSIVGGVHIIELQHVAAGLPVPLQYRIPTHSAPSTLAGVPLQTYVKAHSIVSMAGSVGRGLAGMRLGQEHHTGEPLLPACPSINSFKDASIVTKFSLNAAHTKLVGAKTVPLGGIARASATNQFHASIVRRLGRGGDCGHCAVGRRKRRRLVELPEHFAPSEAVSRSNSHVGINRDILEAGGRKIWLADETSAVAAIAAALPPRAVLAKRSRRAADAADAELAEEQALAAEAVLAPDQRALLAPRHADLASEQILKASPLAIELDQILESLCNRYPIFAYPVSEKEVPGYSRVVRKPMDLGTIRQRLQLPLVSLGRQPLYYTTAAQLKADVALIAVACRQFNSPDNHDGKFYLNLVAELDTAFNAEFDCLMQKVHRSDPGRYGVKKQYRCAIKRATTQSVFLGGSGSGGGSGVEEGGGGGGDVGEATKRVGFALGGSRLGGDSQNVKRGDAFRTTFGLGHRLWRGDEGVVRALSAELPCGPLPAAIKMRRVTTGVMVAAAGSLGGGDATAEIGNGGGCTVRGDAVLPPSKLSKVEQVNVNFIGVHCPHALNPYSSCGVTCRSCRSSMLVGWPERYQPTTKLSPVL